MSFMIFKRELELLELRQSLFSLVIIKFEQIGTIRVGTVTIFFIDFKFYVETTRVGTT